MNKYFTFVIQITLILIIVLFPNVSCKKKVEEEQPILYYPNELTVIFDYNKQEEESILYPDSRTATHYIDITDSLYFKNAQNIGIYFFNPNNRKIEQTTIQIIFKDNNVWERSSSSRNFHVNLDNGWEIYRWPVSDGDTVGFGILPYKIRITVEGEAPNEIEVRYVFAETPDKAKILLIQDGGYSKGWIDSNMVEGQEISGIESCTIRGIPITWALNPQKIEERDSVTIPIEYLKEMQKNSINHWSFHSYARQALSDASVEELEQDYINSLNWLKNNGFGTIHFRAAYTQNNAPNALYITDFIKQMGIHAAGTYTQSTGGSETFPFTNRWNINRWAIHGSDKEEIDEKFRTLKQRHCIILAYTHKIISDNEDSPYDTKLENWNYFLNKIDEGVNEGWLEAVSYDDLEAILKEHYIYDDDEDIAKAILRQLYIENLK